MTEPEAVAGPFADAGQQALASRLGIWLFLATEGLLFSGVFIGYVVYRVLWPEVFATASGHLDLWLGTLNTVLLLTSSFTMAAAHATAAASRARATAALLGATALLGFTFLAIKGLEYRHEYAEGLMPLAGLEFRYAGSHPERAEMFFNLYFIGTGLHALHLLVGLGLLAAMVAQALRPQPAAQLARRVAVAGVYWHFIDVLWIFLFPMFYLI